MYSFQQPADSPSQQSAIMAVAVLPCNAFLTLQSYRLSGSMLAAANVQFLNAAGRREGA